MLDYESCRLFSDYFDPGYKYLGIYENPDNTIIEHGCISSILYLYTHVYK